MLSSRRGHLRRQHLIRHLEQHAVHIRARRHHAPVGAQVAAGAKLHRPAVKVRHSAPALGKEQLRAGIVPYVKDGLWARAQPHPRVGRAEHQRRVPDVARPDVQPGVPRAEAARERPREPVVGRRRPLAVDEAQAAREAVLGGGGGGGGGGDGDGGW
ncbi:hypothetical protein CRV24_007601 [Beauveria bassiana]|nr:hypothetical protein CRV24_007601 [Beauveria bassiana]